jgi:phosphoesterase RecJ-like protein
MELGEHWMGQDFLVMDDESYALFDRLCSEANTIVMATHIHPDGDALGSELSLGRFLIERGKKVRIVNHDPTAAALKFIEDPSLPIEAYRSDEHDSLLLTTDLVILVDNSAPDRLGRMEQPMIAAAGRVLCIDHHPTRDAPWQYNIVDVDSSATSAMIYDLTRAAGWTPDARAAQAIYVGLATDTGFFRFNSTTPNAHRIAAELLQLEVDPAAIYQAVCERNSEAFTRLLGHALADLRLAADGRVALVTIGAAHIRDLGAEDVDTSEITTSLLAMQGVLVALLFRELDGGRVKVSLRSKGDLDVHQLATEFGGGGHRNASGIVLEGRLDDVVEQIVGRATGMLAASSSDASG